MFPLTTRQPVRYTPPVCKTQENPPVYLIGVASVYGRAEFRSRMAELGLSCPSDEETREALIDGIRAVCEEDQQDQLIAIVEETAAYDGKPLPEELDALYRKIERQIRPHYGPYGELVGARTRFFEMLPILACKFFLKGAENAGVELTFKNGLLSDESLTALDPDHVTGIGWQAHILMHVGGEQEKNSASPSPSPGIPESSPTGDTLPKAATAGKSAARSTPKTRKTG